MGSRGPQPGFKRRKAEAKALSDAALAQAARAALTPSAQLLLTGPKLTVAQQNNPGLVGGDQLRALAHRMGMSKSSMAGMSETKIREQLRYITADRAEREPA